MNLLIFGLTISFLLLGLIYYYWKYHREKTTGKKLTEDMDELKQDFEVLQKNSQIKADAQKLKLILENLPFGLILTEEKGQVIYLNPKAEVFLGISLSECLEKNLGQFIKFSDTNNKDYSASEIISVSSYRLTPNKLEFKTAIKAIWLQTMLNRFEIRNAPNYLWILNDVKETNVEMTKMQSFYAQAAHDLKTPISIIKATVELLLMDAHKLVPDKQKELLVDTKTQADLLQTLVEDILNVARLEQGKVQPSLKPVLVSNTILSSIKKHETLLKKKGLGMEFNPADLSGIKVMADAYLLQTIVDNLISNAIKYTFTGTITISIAKENSHIFVNVTDTGVGIDKEQQRLLFKIYQQVGEARKLPTEKSTGLGLFIAKEMVRLMNGEVTLTASEPGRGSTFTLKLPAA